MADLKENIQQAIADFDAIKAALEESGVEVPYDTDTSEYGNLVRMVAQNNSTAVAELAEYVDTELAKKVDKVEGSRLMTETEAEQLAKLVAGDYTCLIETVKVADIALPIVDKAVNIPVAGDDVLGVVKSSTGENAVSIADDGTMYVGVININTLVQTEGEELVLKGGSSK